MQTETSSRSTKHAGAKPPAKPEVKHTVLHADKKSDVKIDGKADPNLKDWTVFLTADAGGNLTQQVVCRPIGNVPGTTTKSYVMFPSDHVRSFVANIPNPLEAAANVELAKARDTFYTTVGLYKNEGGVLFWGETPVADLWREAKKSSETAFKVSKEAYYAGEEAAGRYRQGSPKNPGNAKDKVAPPYSEKAKPISDFLPKDFVEELDSAEKAWKKSQAFRDAEIARTAAINRYETKGGPDGTTPQNRLDWLEGVPPKLVKQYLNRVLTDPVGVMAEIRTRYGADQAAT